MSPIVYEPDTTVPYDHGCAVPSHGYSTVTGRWFSGCEPGTIWVCPWPGCGRAWVSKLAFGVPEWRRVHWWNFTTRRHIREAA